MISDTVFSMDGDIADLSALLALRERHDALLLLDDAHGFGLLGPQGRGALAAAGLAGSEASPRLGRALCNRDKDRVSPVPCPSLPCNQRQSGSDAVQLRFVAEDFRDINKKNVQNR